MRYLRMYKWQTLNKNCIATLLSGLAIGFTVAYMLFTTDDPFADPHSSYEMHNMQGPEVDPGGHSALEDYHLMEDTSVADKLYKKVRVLCWIMTSPSNHEKKARHVKKTWGKRCNILLFMSTKADDSLPAIALDVREGRKYLWGKTKRAFQHIYKNYLDQADWFVKADDDTTGGYVYNQSDETASEAGCEIFEPGCDGDGIVLNRKRTLAVLFQPQPGPGYMIVENLRYMLMKSSPNEPVYYGCKFKPFVKQGYMSGGAGYVLSREAVKKFIEVGLKNATGCAAKSDGGPEDVELGKCMEAANVRAGDTRDSLGRGRFFPFVPEHHLIPGHVSKSFWYWSYIYYDSKEGMECCSDNAVSFHYISPNQMYVLEYLIYHLRPYGISNLVEMPHSLADNKDAGKSSDKNNSTEKNGVKTIK